MPHLVKQNINIYIHATTKNKVQNYYILYDSDTLI